MQRPNEIQAPPSQSGNRKTNPTGQQALIDTAIVILHVVRKLRTGQRAPRDAAQNGFKENVLLREDDVVPAIEGKLVHGDNLAREVDGEAVVVLVC